jgi:hypothetical protein
MTPPPKKPAAAKSTAVEDEPRAKKKSRDDETSRKKTKPRDDDDDEDDRPRAKKKPRDDDDEDDDRPRTKKKLRAEDDDEDDDGDFDTDGKAAKRLDLDPGFRDRALMKQVAKELSNGEVLHYACRPSEAIAQKQALMAIVAGAAFALFGIVFAVPMLTAMNVPTAVATVPCVFVLVGVAFAVLGPIVKKRQARLGWYAVTDRRAVVFHISLWGSSGLATTYHPAALRRMWVKKSFWLKTGGDIVFKTVVTRHTHTERTRHGGTRTSSSTSTEHFGFLGIDEVKDVEALLREVLLTRRDEDDEDDDD